MGMKFRDTKNLTEIKGTLFYEKEEFSLNTEPFYENGFSSLLINDIQLEIDEDSVLLYIWGFCPLQQAKEIDSFPSYYETRQISVLTETPLIAGISKRINHARWDIFYNKANDWICIGNPKLSGQHLIQFAPGAIATIENQEIIALWLHPIFH